MNNVFRKIDIRVFDKFIEKFAEKYVEQRSALTPNVIDDVLKMAEGLGSGFDLSQIKTIVNKNAVYTVREVAQ